jgi:hypothetical protein
MSNACELMKSFPSDLLYYCQRLKSRAWGFVIDATGVTTMFQGASQPRLKNTKARTRGANVKTARLLFVGQFEALVRGDHVIP